MQVFIRTLRNTRQETLWINTLQRETLRLKLNTLGFYVLSGIEDSLLVYAIKEDESWLTNFGAIIVRLVRKRQID